MEPPKITEPSSANRTLLGKELFDLDLDQVLGTFLGGGDHLGLNAEWAGHASKQVFNGLGMGENVPCTP